MTFGRCDVWVTMTFTTTYHLKFIKIRRNSVENVPELILVFYYYYHYYYLQSKSTVAGGIDCLVILYLHASSDCLESRMLFFQTSHGFYVLPQPLVGLEVGRHTILIRGAMLCTRARHIFSPKVLVIPGKRSPERHD